MEENTRTQVNIFSENDLRDRTINLITDKSYTKEEVINLLTPIWNYLELLSETYDINLTEGMKFQFNRPKPENYEDS